MTSLVDGWKAVSDLSELLKEHSGVSEGENPGEANSKESMSSHFSRCHESTADD